MTHVIDFILNTEWDDLPQQVQHQAKRCLLDTLSAGIGGRLTDLSRIIYDFASAQFGGDQAKLWFDGRPVSAAGLALAAGMTIDSLDIHDGYNFAKGHAGAGVVPAVLACVSLGDQPLSGKALLTSIAVAYELSLRAGHALHETVPDYHTSGAWNALGAAAAVCRRLDLDAETTRHALGIAEYHGPRSQMMRVIDYPTMLKDGSGWGAMAGISAGLMAAAGFTGAPAVTVEREDAARFWETLGREWVLLDQYFKPMAVCRWAQPAVMAALHLQTEEAFDPGDIDSIEITSFHEAVRLATAYPKNTEEAQYSLPFPVAAALVHGRLGPAEISGDGLTDPTVIRYIEKMTLHEDDRYNEAFPATRYARVQLNMKDGRILHSGDHTPNWDGTDPPTDQELIDKFRWLARTVLSDDAADRLETLIWTIDEREDVTDLVDALAGEKYVLEAH